MLPNSASFLVTEDCNLACKYCFEKHNKNYMTKEIARKGLDFICNNAIKEKQDHFHAMIFGGEPLLNLDVVEEIFKYGIELAEKNNIQFTTSIVTNATIMNDKVKRIIKTYKDKAKLSVQLSIDGVKEVQDAYRVTKNGKGSFNIVEKNVPIWKDIFKDNIYALSIHGCCNRDTLKYLFKNYKYFREVWDVPRLWFMPIHSEDWEEGDEEIYREELQKIADYILDRVKKENNIQEIINYAPLDRCLNRDGFPLAPCGAGKNFITITAKGDIYPCHHFYFNDPERHTIIGNIWDGIDDQRRAIFMHYDNDDLSCKKKYPKCDAYGCYRCIAENWQQNGSILSVVDCGGIRCKMSRIEREIQLNLRKEVENMGLLNNNQNINYAKGNNPNNPDCLCDSRGIPVNSYTNEDNEIIAMALKLILEKVDLIEKEQAVILKKLL